MPLVFQPTHQPTIRLAQGNSHAHKWIPESCSQRAFGGRVCRKDRWYAHVQRKIAEFRFVHSKTGLLFDARSAITLSSNIFVFSPCVTRRACGTNTWICDSHTPEQQSDSIDFGSAHVLQNNKCSTLSLY